MKFIGVLALLCSCLLSSLSWPQGGTDHFYFLHYLKREHPVIYRDFLLRFNAVSFLQNMEKTITHLQLPRETTLFPSSLLHINIDVSSQVEKKVADTSGTETLRRDLIDFLRSQGEKSLELVIQEHLEGFTFERAFRTQGLATALFLATQPTASEKARFFQSDLDGKMQQAGEKVKSLESLRAKGFEPRKFGLQQPDLTGREAIELLQTVHREQMRFERSFLYLGYLKARHVDLKSRAIEASKNVHQDTARRFSDLIQNGQIIEQLVQSVSDFIELNHTKQAREIGRHVRSFIDRKVSSGVKQSVWETQSQLSLQEGNDAFTQALRGSPACDCSTKVSSEYAVLAFERIFFIRRQGKITGSLSGALVTMGTQKGFYLHTLSGNLGRQDALVIIEALEKNKSTLGVDHIVFPPKNKIDLNFNHPVIRGLIHEIVDGENTVDIKYADEKLRTSVEQITSHSYDRIDQNSKGVIYKGRSLSGHSISTTTESLSPLDWRQEKISKEDGLRILLDLHMTGVRVNSLWGALDTFKITPADFDQLVKIIKNDERHSVSDFLERVRQKMIRMNLRTSLSSIEEGYMVRGYLQASDAFSPEHRPRTLEFIKEALTSFSHQDFIYQAISNHAESLNSDSKFRKIVLTLLGQVKHEFKIQQNDDVILRQSAEATLLRLFSTGIDHRPYREQLARNASLQAEDTPYTRLRKATFWSKLEPTQPSHIDLLFEELGQLAHRTQKVDADLKNVVSRALSQIYQTLTDDREKTLFLRRFHPLLPTRWGVEVASVMVSTHPETSHELNAEYLIDKKIEVGFFKHAAQLLIKLRWTGSHAKSHSWLRAVADGLDRGYKPLLVKIFTRNWWAHHEMADETLRELHNLSDKSHQLRLAIVDALTSPAWEQKDLTFELLRDDIQDKSLRERILKRVFENDWWQWEDGKTRLRRMIPEDLIKGAYDLPPAPPPHQWEWRRRATRRCEMAIGG